MSAERTVSSYLPQSEHVPPGTRARLLPLTEVAARPLTTIGIGRAGFTDAPAGYRRSVLGPQTHRAMVTLSGCGFFEAGGQRYELPEGTLLVWPAGVAAVYGTLGEATWKRAWVSLANIPRWAAITRSGVRCERCEVGEKLKVAMEGFIAELGLAPPDSLTSPHTHGRARNGLESDTRELGGGVADDSLWAYPPRPDGAARARALPANMYARILRAHVHAMLRVPDIDRVESDGARLDRLWAHVQDHLSEDWTVDTLSKRMAVAPATLHRMTQRRYGTTPGGLLLRMRMEEAQRLLALTDEPVQKLAERFGYASPFAFSTAFKRATGLAPRAFRDQNRVADHRK